MRPARSCSARSPEAPRARGLTLCRDGPADGSLLVRAAGLMEEARALFGRDDFEAFPIELYRRDFVEFRFNVEKYWSATVADAACRASAVPLHPAGWSARA